MRGILSALGLSLVLLSPASAQGIKDPPNYPASSVPKWQKTQAAKSAAEHSRPTAVRNLPAGSLPTGLAAQGVYKDGKLVAVPRY